MSLVRRGRNVLMRYIVDMYRSVRLLCLKLAGSTAGPELFKTLGSLERGT